MAPEAEGFRLERDPGARRVTLEIARAAEAGFEGFAPEAVALPPGTPTVMIDPGHGGPDAGVEGGGLTEKLLTLQLAHELRGELERRGIARVLLTRDEDRALSQTQRAETANRARVALFLSLHFDGFPAARSRGVTAWCPPASRVAASRAGAGAALDLVPWRDAARGHAARGRALAEAVRSAFVLRDLGPVRVREAMTAPLEGVDAPALMLDCATLTAPADAERLRRPDGLRTMAATLADAIAAWRKRS